MTGDPEEANAPLNAKGPAGKGAAEGTTRSLMVTAALVAAYLCLNTTMNVLNKWTLGIYGFSFPLFLTTAHMVFSFIVLLPFMMVAPFRELHRGVLTKQWKGLVFMAVNIAFNNLSLVSLSLSLNQVIRSSIPCMTALLAVVVEGKVPSRFEAVALAVLCAGVMLTVWEGLAGSAAGVLLCLAGTVSNAAMMTISARVLSERVDALRLTFYTAPVSCLILLPFYHLREPGAVLQAGRLAAYAARHPDSAFLGVLAASCACALTYNVVHCLMIQRTSAVTTTVLGEIKIVAILMLSAAVFGEGRLMTLRMALGCAVALLGFILYSHAKLAPAKPPEPAAAKAHTALISARTAVEAQLGGWEGAGSGIKALQPGWPTPSAAVTHQA